MNMHYAAPAMTLGSCCRMRSPSAVRTPGCPLHTSLARCGYSRLQCQGGEQSITTQHLRLIMTDPWDIGSSVGSVVPTAWQRSAVKPIQSGCQQQSYENEQPLQSTVMTCGSDTVSRQADWQWALNLAVSFEYSLQI